MIVMDVLYMNVSTLIRLFTPGGTSTVEDDELLKVLAIFGGGTPPPCGCDLRDMFNVP